MATLTSTACQTNNGGGFFLNAPKYIEQGMISRSVKHTFSPAQSSGDIIQMMPIPKGAHIHDVILCTDGLGGGALTVTLGDGNSATRYFGSISTNTATVFRVSAGAAIGYSYSAEDTIDLVVGTATSASAGTSMRLTVFYSMDQSTDGNS